MSNYTCGPVCIDELVTVLAQYDPLNRWNGWLAAPHMDAYSVVRVIDALRAAGSATSIDWDGGALLLTEYDGDDSEGEAFTETIPPDEDGLFTPGAFGWVWSEDHDLDCAGLMNLLGSHIHSFTLNA